METWNGVSGKFSLEKYNQDVWTIWEGMVRSVQVFNRDLSPQQVFLLSSGQYHILHGSELGPGQWFVMATPIKDGVAGAPIFSNAITI